MANNVKGFTEVNVNYSYLVLILEVQNVKKTLLRFIITCKAHR